ncbi:MULTISPECIES: hypothetical protein [Paenibacillus]|uniref:hypothetical protein n=1 Tax=Paenibacillus TaxID=44249 RepID=UPI001B885E0F|nr:hypothetical protein [Paenibacillus anaericanus]
MGLDAYVNCNCVKEGKVKPPPFDISLLEWTDEGIDLSDSADDGTYHLFLKWREHACEHENFRYYYNRVANIAGGNFFFGAMERLGQENFPLLNSIWGNTLSASQANKALKELDILESRVSELQGVFLLESKSQEEYARALPGDDRWFYSSGMEFTYRLNDNGFRIVNQDNLELFRSMAFTQEVVCLEKDSRVGRLVWFCDSETGSLHKSTHPLSKKIWGVEELYYPNSMQVVTRELKCSDLHSTVVLRELFEASLQTGNSIIWV